MFSTKIFLKIQAQKKHPGWRCFNECSAYSRFIETFHVCVVILHKYPAVMPGH